MNEIKKMFQSWRKFLEGSLNESITDRAIDMDASSAKTFVKFFVRSEETAILALQMIESSINDWENLKVLSIDSPEYRDRAKGMLRDENAVTEDEKINRCIEELNEIKSFLKKEYNL